MFSQEFKNPLKAFDAIANQIWFSNKSARIFVHVTTYSEDYEPEVVGCYLDENTKEIFIFLDSGQVLKKHKRKLYLCEEKDQEDFNDFNAVEELHVAHVAAEKPVFKENDMVYVLSMQKKGKVCSCINGVVDVFLVGHFPVYDVILLPL